MGVTYAPGSDVATLEPQELSERLNAVVTSATVWLGGISDAAASRPEREGKWSAKQVMGHLTDSAVNNLGRIVQMQIAPGAKLPGYEQMVWVSLQHYGEREWAKVLETWAALNGQVVWAIAHVEKVKLANRGEVAGVGADAGLSD